MHISTGSTADVVFPCHCSRPAWLASSKSHSQPGLKEASTVCRHCLVLLCPCCIVHKWFVCRQDGAVSGRTTNFSRTIATLQGVLTGLYPDTPQPIPVATASDIDEIMFANVLSCEKLADVMKRARYKLRGTDMFMNCVLLPSTITACTRRASRTSGPACAWLRPWHALNFSCCWVYCCNQLDCTFTFLA